MKSKNEMRSVWATYLCIAGTALLLWITVQLLIQRAKYYWRLPFFRGLWLTLSERSGWSAMVLIFCCLCAIGVSVWMFATPGYGMTDYWETDSRLRRRRILKKVAAEENIDTLANICREAPLREVREAAGTRRDGLMRPLFEEVAAQRDIRAVDRIRIGSPYREVREAAEAKKEELMRAALASGDLAGIGNMIDHIIECSYMEKSPETDILAEAAAKYPQLVQTYWTRLRQWAHCDDPRSHRDSQPNKLFQYYDCHEDRHKDTVKHLDLTNEEKIARFKPVLPEE